MKRRNEYQSPIQWSAMASFEDLRPRQGRWGRYVVGYTNKQASVCMSEKLAHTLCLFEPYNLKGEIKAFKGGMYLKLIEAELFRAKDYQEKPI